LKLVRPGISGRRRGSVEAGESSCPRRAHHLSSAAAPPFSSTRALTASSLSFARAPAPGSSFSSREPADGSSSPRPRSPPHRRHWPLPRLRSEDLTGGRTFVFSTGGLHLLLPRWCGRRPPGGLEARVGGDDAAGVWTVETERAAGKEGEDFLLGI
jgi:hypothetical protein